VTAVRSFLTTNVGLAKGSFRYENGSGLFDSNGFTPEQMVRVLSTAYRDFRIGPDFVSSLSIAAADGTLRRRMVAGPAARHVRAKTGTLAHVSALAGYVAVDSRAPLCFAVFVNDVPKWRVNDARSLADSIATSAMLYARSR
jgi:D-alanyl-D-alanine carboxypeptidase/D-alanyl-D-alanine-endopeptidase (penicillin-binding protein 4)